MDYENLIDQLSNNKTAIVHLLKSVSSENALWKPSFDRWSVLEVVCHLIDIEVEDFRYDFDLILNHPEDPWPHFDEIQWVTSREYNKKNYQEKVEKFINERDKSITWLSAIDNPDLNALHSGNEFKGERKSAGDILASWVAHDLFHIRQLSLLNLDILNYANQSFSTSYSGFYK